MMSTVIDMTLDPLEDMDPAAVELLQLLADPTRRRIFRSLLRGETCNCELAVELDLAHNLISHHLKRLRLAGLIQERRDRHADHWVHYVVNVEVLNGALGALNAALTPAPTDARTPCCERRDVTMVSEPCPTCASRPVARASRGRRALRPTSSSTVTPGSDR
ncbi:MAG: winged helix-turn-helix transcriptional regulator [Chloroflexi bacterium]|nr:winged helix-turn-helix transcriptional regulator [Chloroflexota bacterium]